MNEPNEKELRALDALIAGALLPEMKCENLSKEELDDLIAHAVEPLPEDIAALEKLGNPFLTETERPSCQSADFSVGEMVMAMNRKNSTDKLSDQTRSELERRARELLG
jgi:hypothetical protein